METNHALPNNQDKNSEFQLKPIDAIYMLDDYYLEPIAVGPVSSVNQPIPFDPDDPHRVYFDHSDTPHKTDYADDHPHADIFCQSDGQFYIEYHIIPIATRAEVECLESLVRTKEFQSSAFQRWGSFKLILGELSRNKNYDIGTNMLVYYDDQKASVSLRRVGVQAGMTFAQVMEDYLFLRDVVNRMLWRLKGNQPMQKQKPEESISLKP